MTVLGAPADLVARLTAARRRHAAHYRGVLAAADDLSLAGGAHVVPGLVLFDREQSNIETGQAWAAAAAADDPAAARLCVGYPDAGAYALSLRLHPRQRIAWLERAAMAAREIGGRLREGNALGNLGLAYAALGEAGHAIEHYEQRLAIAREIGDRRGEGIARYNLGLAYADLGEPRRAIAVLGEALTIFETIESPHAAKVRASITRLTNEGGAASRWIRRFFHLFRR